jgi:glycosyltransferase involved in cell wall biosynthesis
MSDRPLISCLCVTRDKVPLLERAIRCFQDQTYVNRELVIVHEDDDLPTKQFLKGLSDRQILRVEVAASPKLTLGKLRNLSVQKCNGEYFCQWDDDDWSHHRRLEFQMDAIQQSEMPACVMMYWLIFDMTENQAYVSPRRPWEGSLVCKKSLITEELQYGDVIKGEDTIVVEKLATRNLIFPVIRPNLYIYVYHGKNTFGHEHWKELFEASQRLSVHSSNTIKEILEDKYSGEEASRLLEQI